MIKWTRYPGGIAKITRTPGGGAYAKSADGRFMIFVSRYLRGDPGYRAYVYHFSAVDYSIPSAGQRFTSVPIKGGRAYSQNVDDVMASVEQWNSEHPKENPAFPHEQSDAYWDLFGAAVVLLWVGVGVKYLRS